MNMLLIAGLVLGAAAASDGAIEHRAAGSSFRAGRGPLQRRCRRDSQADRRGGHRRASSTLRCMWSANMTVHREARATAGTMLTRSAARDGVIRGSRAGWCGTNRRAIAQEVAQRRDALHDHLQAVAQEDHPMLRAEMDRLHPETREG